VQPIDPEQYFFPLGITFTELSLCRILENLRTPADYDPVGVVSDLKTASRHLQYVYEERGPRHGGAVRKCLFWPGFQSLGFGDERF
jgi:hypothetical protein